MIEKAVKHPFPPPLEEHSYAARKQRYITLRFKLEKYLLHGIMQEYKYINSLTHKTTLQFSTDYKIEKSKGD